MLNVAFLLDITGSMSCELDGVKATVSRLVTTVFADFPNEIVVTIITFTESEKGCYVTRDSFADGSEAASFVNKITLCVPPGMPSVNAHGGDGPENHKAALAELMRLDADVPTVAFLITDAVPHLLDVPSTEATLERNYLSHEYGLVDSDLFTLLDRLVDHFGDSLVLSVVKYYHTTDHALYGAVAKRLNGVLVTPVQRTPEQLANGLMAILLQMFQSLAGAAMTAPSENAETATALSAFSFYDLEAVEIPLNERGRSAIATPHVGSTDELLFKLIERTTVIAGGRFKKRAITAHLVSEQVELLLVMAKGLLREISKDEALERATLLLGKIKALMGEEHASQFKLRVDELDALLSNDAFAAPTAGAVTGDLEVAVSAITLMSIEETARDVMLEGEVDADAPEPRDPYTALLAVASLFLGHLSVLQLPTRMGVVDFMDAWSAVIQKVSNDVVSAADFLTMIGDKESVAGLQRRDSDYNFLQLVADPKDAMGSELLRVASGTQVLDILTALLSGAPAGLFSPNMFRGTISACLMTLLSTHEADLSEYQWEIALKMVHTVRLLMGATPATVVWEPESAMGKLLFRVLRMPVAIVRDDETVLRAFLEEMAAARAQKFAKYNERDYLTLVEELVGYEHDTSSITRDVFDPHVLLDGTELPVDAAHAVAVVTKSAFCANFERCAGNVLRAVFLQDGDSENVPSLTQVWPAYTHDLPKLLLLQKRTERYTLQKGETAEDKDAWVRNAATMAASFDGADEDVFRVRALVLMRQKYDAFIRETRKQRQDEAAQERWRRVVAFMRSPLEQFTTQLGTFVYSSACREHKLLLKAFTMYGGDLDVNEYEAKVTAVVTGRVVGNDDDGTSDRVVFNRGNLHAHPDRFVPMTDAFKAKLRAWQRTHKWSTAHVYRESGVPNHSGFSNANPSAWAARRANGDERTFWEDDEN